METRHGIKYRQLHIEDYLREIPAEQGRVTGVYAHEWITGNPDTNTDFWTNNLLDTILRSDNQEKGKVRKLGIPTVVDRMIQQAIAQELTPIYEEPSPRADGKGKQMEQSGKRRETQEIYNW